jgi:hypothetical protein
MKKLILFLLVATLLCSLSPAMAATIDLSAIQAQDNLYTVDISDDGDAAFIESNLSAEARSFVHKYESSTLYSSTEFDVLIVDYQQSSNYPVFRLWIVYCADNGYINADSVTFQVGKKQFTFTDISDEDWLTYDKENGYMEEMLIRFGEDNVDFLLALEEAIKGKSESVETLNEVGIKMVLHGKEDLVVELGSGFLLDFMALKSAWLDLDGVSYIDDINGNDMTVTTIY